MTSKLRDWLRGNVADVVQVVPRQRPRNVSEMDALDVRTGLDRWAARLTRRRAAALGRRYLLVALMLALVPAVVVLAIGASRPFWVLAVLLLAPGAAAVALIQRTPEARAARVVDRALGLHDQLGTALELQAQPIPPSGLAKMVVNEAGVALAQSLAAAQVRARRAPAEWAWIGVGLCALLVVIAVPRHSAKSHRPGSRVALAVRPHGGATPPQPGSGTTQAVSHTTPLSSRATTSTPAVSQVPLTGGAKAAYGQQGTSTAGSRAPASANGAGTVEGQHTKPGLAVSGGKGAAGSGAAGAQSGKSQTAASPSGTTTGTSGSTAAGKSGAGSTAKPSSGSQGAHAGVTSTTAGKTAGASTGSQKGRSSGGTPAGGTAGTGKAAAHAKLGLAPYGGVGTGKGALPLQATYTPASTSHISVKGGVSPTANGNGNGKGGGRSGHPGSETADSAGSGTDFSVIPPTANLSSPDQDLAQNYFGMTNQVSFKGW